MKYRNIYRWLALPLLLSTVVGLLFVGSACTPATAVSVSPYSQTVAPGQTFTVDILVNPVAEIAGAQFELFFDPSLVTAISVTEGDLLNQGGCDTFFLPDFRPGTIDNDAGTITGVACVITTPGGKVSSSGTLATIIFTAGTTAGSSILQLSNSMVGNSTGQAVSISVTGGRVTVSAE